jgi:outer membrane protein TolC
MRTTNLLATLLLAALVPAAARAQTAPPENAPAPAVPAPAPAPSPALTPEAVPAPAGPVLSLSDVIGRARREGGNPNLVALREQVTQAEANLRRAWAALLPKVTATAAITRNSAEAQFAFPSFGTAQVPDVNGTPVTVFTPGAPVEPITIQPLVTKSLVAQATLPLVVMPAYFGIANAKQAVEAAEHGATFAEDELLLGITQAYYGAVATRRIVEVAEKQLDTAIQQEKLANSLYRIGEQTKVGPLRASVIRSGAEQDLRRARASHQLAKLALVQLAGIQEPFDVAAPPPVPAPEASAEDLVRTGLQSREDLAARRAGAEIADRAVTGAWWQFAPVVSASGQWMRSNTGGFTGDPTTWSATLAASLTVYDGGNRYATLKEAKSQSRAAAANLEATRRQVVTDVQSAAIELDTARGNALAAREQAKLAEETALLVQSQYSAGSATSLELTDATTRRFAASVMAITEELNVDVAVLKLRRSIGRLEPNRLGVAP